MKRYSYKESSDKDVISSNGEAEARGSQLQGQRELHIEKVTFLYEPLHLTACYEADISAIPIGSMARVAFNRTKVEYAYNPSTQEMKWGQENLKLSGSQPS